MGKKWVVLSAVCLLGLIAGAAVAADEQSAGQKAQEKQQQIKSYIALRQVEIERFYVDRAVELQMRTQAEIARLDVAETTGTVILREWAALRAAGTVLEINALSSGHCGYYESEYTALPHRLKLAGNQVERLVLARTKIADAISRAQAQVEWELARLEQQKAYSLGVELPDLERRLTQNTVQPVAGVVTGILYSEDNPAAIIGGAVVHRSQELNGVKVIEIHPDKVEFEKAGQRWQQKVQEESSPQWQ